jgi:hypothetical protein
MAIDNVQITGSSSLEVQSNIISTEEDLGPNETVHFYEPNTGNIMCTIENTSSHYYGCTTVQVDRAGTSFQNIGADNRIFDKNSLITPTTNNLSGSYNLTLYYSAVERDGFINDNDLDYGAGGFLLFKSATNLSTATAATLFSIYETSFGADYAYTDSVNTGFSGFSPGAGGGVLPVELVSFSGRNINKRTNLLEWETATEINSDYFLLERSIDGHNFEIIGRLDAAGNSLTAIQYQLEDFDFQNKLDYYRLKIMDIDGSFEYSEILSIEISEDNSELIIYTNPGEGIFHFQIPNANKQDLQISIIDTKGCIVEKRFIHIDNAELSLDLSYLLHGIYIVQIFIGNKVFSKRLVKELL